MPDVFSTTLRVLWNMHMPHVPWDDGSESQCIRHVLMATTRGTASLAASWYGAENEFELTSLQGTVRECGSGPHIT